MKAWKLVHEIDFQDNLLQHGYPQFGFHDHLGNCYMVHHQLGIIALVQDGVFLWSIGTQNPGSRHFHIPTAIRYPKFVSRSFTQDYLFFTEDTCLYRFHIAKRELIPIVNKHHHQISELGNCVCDAEDTIWVNDIKGNRIFRFTYDGSCLEMVGSLVPGFQLGTVSFEQASFHGIYDIRLGSNNNLYILDSRNYAVRKLDPAARTVTTICGDGIPGYSKDRSSASQARLGGNPLASFDGPWSIALDETNTIYIGDTQNHVIRCIDPSNQTIETIKIATDGQPLVFENICGMDYYNGILLIPDWRKEAQYTLIVLSLA